MTQENLLLEIAWIVKTFQENDGLSFKEMNQMWVDDETFSGGVEMVYANFHRHLRDLDKSLGILITYDHRRHKYYLVNKEPVRGRELLKWLFETQFTTRSLSKLISLPDRVSLQQFSMGLHVIDDIVDAIKYNKVLVIDYRAQGHHEFKSHTVWPYGLKMYESRLYMIAKLRDTLIPFELDRIKELSFTGQMFEMPEDFNIHDYYFHFFGVFRDENIPPEEVVIWAFDNENRYLDELPLHHSQRKINRKTAEKRGYHEYKLFVSPTNDFIGKVMSRTDRLVVVRPQWVVDKIMKRLDNMQNNYKNITMK